MKHNWSRFGIGLLCLIFLMGLMGVPMEANAEIETDEYGNISFSSFTDLKELSSRTYESYTSATYTGIEPLVIEDDLELQENVAVTVDALTIPEGVTLTLPERNWLYADSISVEGTFNCYGWVRVFESLIIKGKLALLFDQCDSSIHMEDRATLEGSENIAYAEEWLSVSWSHVVDNMTELKNALQFASGYTDPHLVHYIHLDNNILVDDSLSVPSNVSISFGNVYADENESITITVAAGCTLELHGDGSVSGIPYGRDELADDRLVVDGTLICNDSFCADGPVEVNGKIICNGNIGRSEDIAVNGILENNGSINILYDYGAKLEFSDDYVYTGRGGLYIVSEELDKPDEAVPGLKLSDFEITRNEDANLWSLQYIDSNEDTNPDKTEPTEPESTEPEQSEPDTEFETDEHGRAIFTSFEELKELASRTDGKYTSAIYQGTEALVIEEDLAMPDDFQLYTKVWFSDSEDCKIIIPEGVTFTADLVSAENLILNGTLVCDWLNLYCEAFDISGMLYLNGDLEMSLAYSKITGAENIVYGNEWSRVYWDYSSKQPLDEILNIAQKATDPRWVYRFNYSSLLHVEKDIVIPENFYLVVYEGITIDQGCTLTLKSMTSVHSGSVVVNGTLENLNYLIIDSNNGGMLTIAEDGCYIGGMLCIEKGPQNDLESVVIGLDLSQYEVLDYDSQWLLQPITMEEVTITRTYGDNRFDTAFVVADQMKANLGIEKFDAVVVASGTNFADALSGSYLSAAKNAPILLSFTTDAINNGVKDYIRENLNEGGTVYILGGESAVPASFETGLDGFTVKRLAGGNRFETNLMILEEAGVGDKPVLVCTGLGFADSLSASAAKLPILLVWNDLTEGQKNLLDSLSGNKLYIIGGESAVSSAMEEQLKAYGETERVAGGNRFETSVAIAETFFSSPKSAVLAYAWNFPDGLCGGPLAATLDAPLILTMDKFEAKAAEYVQNWNVRNGVILGGEGLISEATVNNIFN